jgi:hypothetical protein
VRQRWAGNQLGEIVKETLSQNTQHKTGPVEWLKWEALNSNCAKKEDPISTNKKLGSPGLSRLKSKTIKK